ncbi:MAG TPA: right-handed parallel beta-helix repeat-containing protein [Edaphocola sp.]|nr:right-handed parallel beta-helix repeat-containing protein [Edaphocola sp.]
MRRYGISGWCPALLLILSFSACKKQSWLNSGGKITFSVDTLMFDTVFTAQGSATRSLKIFNPQKQGIHISSIRFEKGNASPFRLNVNGYTGKEVDHVDISGKDSVWIFTAVTINPDSADNPFLVEDKLLVTLNDQTFSIPVIAYGQNAHYIVDSVLQTQTWINDKPYVIIHNALVDNNATLTIKPGVRVYMHQDSRLFVMGSLNIEGQKGDSVIFQGDRIDRDIYVGNYDDIPGEWGGLYFFPQSHSNVINYAVFKNGGASTQLSGQTVLGATIQINKDSLQNGQPVLNITNSIIHHSQGYGIVAFNSSMYAANCLIAACGAENMMLMQGGDYKIYDCTIATYGSTYIDHSKYVSMGVLNYYPVSQSSYIGGDLTADIRGCIIYGSLDDELVIDKKNDFTANIQLSHCLVKSAEALPAFVNASGNIFNEDPMFVKREKMDFHVQAASPAVHNGIIIPGITEDLDGVTRPAGSPTIGCYEFH